jgi:hypothetical protein
VVRTPTGDFNVLEDEIATRFPISSHQVDRHRIRICIGHNVRFQERICRVIGQLPDWVFILDQDEIFSVQPIDVEMVDVHKRSLIGRTVKKVI